MKILILMITISMPVFANELCQKDQDCLVMKEISNTSRQIYHEKIPKCIENQCQMMTKHICCSKIPKEVYRSTGCAKMKVSCRLVKY